MITWWITFRTVQFTLFDLCLNARSEGGEAGELMIYYVIAARQISNQVAAINFNKMNEKNANRWHLMRQQGTATTTTASNLFYRSK